ncbi:hypothetical protein ABK040_013464 [Willaertia magna]
MSYATVDFKIKEIIKDGNKRPCLIFQDCFFEKPTKLAFIVFRNYYCSHITIKHQTKSGTFVTLLSNYKLMQNPNFENDSQDYHRINCATVFNKNFNKDLLFTNLRFFYYQPSPNWKSFQLKNFVFYELIEQTNVKLPEVVNNNKDKTGAHMKKEKEEEAEMSSMIPKEIRGIIEVSSLIGEYNQLYHQKGALFNSGGNSIIIPSGMNADEDCIRLDEEDTVSPGEGKVNTTCDQTYPKVVSLVLKK